MKELVGASGFEPPTSWSRTNCLGITPLSTNSHSVAFAAVCLSEVATWNKPDRQGVGTFLGTVRVDAPNRLCANHARLLDGEAPYGFGFRVSSRRRVGQLSCRPKSPNLTPTLSTPTMATTLARSVGGISWKLSERFPVSAVRAHFTSNAVPGLDGHTFQFRTRGRTRNSCRDSGSNAA